MTYVFNCRSRENWLEAATYNVEECAFSWRGKCPKGHLSWFDDPTNSGLSLVRGGRHDSSACPLKVWQENDQHISQFETNIEYSQCIR